MQQRMFSPGCYAFFDPCRARRLLKLISRGEPCIVDIYRELIQRLLGGCQPRLERLFAHRKDVAIGSHSLDRFREHLYFGRMGSNNLLMLRIMFLAGVLDSLPEFVCGVLPERRLIGDKIPDGLLKFN
ncbi:hypothetical protein ABW54_24970 [Burkholderia cenocepacia]|nr:hypothetical protein ABW54_24970 [Burkholderia cenocepacia]